MFDVDPILRALDDEQVDYVVVGGVALTVHGSARLTSDVDICYSRTAENLERISRALVGLDARLRGAPEGLPFKVDPPTLKAGLNFTFATDAGDLDILGEVSGVGGFDRVVANAIVHDLFGRRVRVMSLDDLEKSKRAAGRRKDLLALDEIAELRRRIERPDPPE